MDENTEVVHVAEGETVEVVADVEAHDASAEVAAPEAPEAPVEAEVAPEEAPAPEVAPEAVA